MIMSNRKNGCLLVKIIKNSLTMAVDEEFEGQSIEEIAEGKFNGNRHVMDQ